MTKVNKLNKFKKKTQKKVQNKLQYGGQIDETYINNVFEFIYNDMFIDDLITQHDRIEYIKNNILDYEFFSIKKLDGISLNKNNFLNPEPLLVSFLPPLPPPTPPTPPEELEDLDIELYSEWVHLRFNLQKSEPHFRIIDNDPKSGNFQSINHREFTNKDEYGGTPYTWNVLCYYKNINCNLYNSGLGIIYKSNDKDKDGNNIIKRVALPVIDGLTLKIRDCYFFHFTPPLEYNKKSKHHSNNKPKKIRRIIIRSYHGNKYEDSIFCYNDTIKKLPIYQFTHIRNSTTPPVRPRLIKITL